MSSLISSSHTEQRFTVLRMSGELDLETQPEFEQTVCDHLLRGPVVVDLSGVEFVAISALRSLGLCHSTAILRGTELYYAEPPAQLRRLLALAGITDVLPLRRTVAEVLCPPNLSRQPAEVSTP